MSRSQLDPADIAAVRDLLPAFDCLWAADKVPPPEAAAAGRAPVPERRLERRYAEAALDRLARACVFPGIELRLVNLSSSGALFESRTRFTPDRPIRLVFVTAEGETAADGIVLRSSLHAIAAQEVCYRSAVRFVTSVAIDRIVR